ncbi:MAG: hypothetical protein M3022_08550 [Actinomycetota bacterium]|nr:hypothetical protein [Actinomycetota bacterium]
MLATKTTRTSIKGTFFASRRRALSLGVCAVAVSGVFASSSVAAVTPITYVRPNAGLVISGHAGQLKITLRVSAADRSSGLQRVQVRLGCYGQFVAGAKMPVTYNSFALVRHGEFATPPGFGAFSASGFFRTPTTAHVDIKLVSLAVKRRCAPPNGQASRKSYGLRIRKIRKRGTPPVTPLPGQVAVTLTQCPSNTRTNPLSPNQHFQVRGQVLPAHAGEIVRVEYTTLQGEPATGKPTVFSYTQADGTFTADFGVPNNNGSAAEAGVSAYAFGKTATCTFFDK